MMDRSAELYDGFRWQVPEHFNIAQACCGRWGAGPSRRALYWEDESGAQAQLSFPEVQLAANRLSNALAALGVKRRDRVAIILPQRPETAVAYIALFQMGAIALPLSHLFGPEALEYRMQHAEASVAIVEPTTLSNLCAIRERLPHLRHVIGAGGAMDANVHAWDTLLARSSDSFYLVDTRADDPALIIYTSGTTGPPKGALKAHRVMLGNVPGFVHSHDFFPTEGALFWSPADWAWTGGLMDALLPSWFFGVPIVGYRGRFDAEKAYYLIEKYGVRNSFLFPTALKLMMKAEPQPKKKHHFALRSVMSAGESVGTTVIEWARAELGARPFDHRRADRLAGAHDRAKGEVVLLLRLRFGLHHQLERGREEEGVAHAVLLDQVVGFLGIEAATVADDRNAKKPARQERVHKAAGPGPVGGRPEQSALRREEVVRMDEPWHVAEHHAVRLERALRRPGGAARVDDERRVVRPGVDQIKGI